MSTTRGTYTAILVMIAGCLDVRPVAPPSQAGAPGRIVPPQGWANRRSLTAALHLHGWSNHSANSEPASIAWHTEQHAAAGVDLLWWTDHSDVYLGRVKDFIVTPSTAVESSPGLWTVGTWGPGGAGTAFLRTVGTPSVDSGAGRITVVLPPGDSTARDSVELFFGQLIGSAPRRAALTILARPLVGQPQFNMTVWHVDPSGDFPDARVIVPLAWHPGPPGGVRQVLEYTVQSDAGSAVEARGDTIEVRRAWASGDSAVLSLQPAADASAFPDGIDNTTDEYRLWFIVRRSDPPSELSFTFPTIANTASGAAAQMAPAVALAHAAAEAKGVRMMWGLEVAPMADAIVGTPWYAANGAGRHLALYLPEDLPASLESSLVGSHAAFAALADSLGGITSIAHPFGTSVAFPVQSDSQQSDAARQLGALLVKNGGWGASLIEVGYTNRGGASLRAHLHLLDYLLASGLHLCGIGATDSHGGPLLRDPVAGFENQYNYVTWIGDVDRTASGAELIAALRVCDVSFGDPFYTRGGMWIQVDSTSGRTHTISLDVNGVSPSASLFLYEAEIDSTGIAHDPVYREYGAPVNVFTHPRVGGCRPGFVRLEAWAGTRPLAFSNVLRLPPDPNACATPTDR
jgi:hypothetical protein